MAEKKPTFEEALGRLEKIVSALEKGDVSLEESIRLFEEGSALMKLCSQTLDKAEQKVMKLMPNEKGEPTESPMETAK